MKPLVTVSKEDLVIERLGDCPYVSPIYDMFDDEGDFHFVDESERILFYDQLSHLKGSYACWDEVPSLELAGPRMELFFDPAKVTCAIVTCGGLCPGLNDVIRGITKEAMNRYKVRRVLGVRFGYQGLVERYGHEPIELEMDHLASRQREGGTWLGSSRGHQPAEEMVEWLVRRGVDILFVIGGDGTLRGAHGIYQEIKKRGLPISVVAIPKTIDNDIRYIDNSFGFETAFGEAVDAVRAAKVESVGAPNGVGLVKLMGRESGFIAANAALARCDVDFVLIPESPITLEGPGGFLHCLEKKVRENGHALVIVAEGTGQNWFENNGATDASGNQKLKDVGLYLKDRITTHFRDAGLDLNLKYIDPSYMVRALAANPRDAVYCTQLAQCAVHAAMAGKTNVVMGRYHMRYVHLPIPLLTQGRSKVDTQGDLWLSVVESTGQPLRFEPQPQPIQSTASVR